MAYEFTDSSYDDYVERMKKSADALRDNLNTIRAGRANPRILDRITAEYYGVQTPINQMAAIAVPEARMMTITPWDPTALRAIERALQMSDLGINPIVDGKMIRLTFPPLTEERRRDLVRQTQKYGEEARVAVRNIRRDAIDDFRKLEKNREISEDQMYMVIDDVQKITDKAIAEIDEITAAKEEELMAI
ncbi:MAG: ribosome recycling factor [Clostridiaceae bacterium]|nr:ribosome recycling factor [Clostridiaceae bacterium]